jgi:hypothetical protein
LLLTLLGTNFRQAASVLRRESAQSRQILRDEGPLRAAGAGVRLLQNGPPASDPFLTRLSVATSSGPRRYVVTLTSEPERGANHWSVSVTPAPLE